MRVAAPGDFGGRLFFLVMATPRRPRPARETAASKAPLPFGLRGMDFVADAIKCSVVTCQAEAKFIVKFQPHPHYQDRWYPVCINHVKHSETTPCLKCSGLLFKRQAIEAL